MAGAGTEGLGNMNEEWGGPPMPPAPDTTNDQLQQLMRQMAQLRDENVQLRDDLLDLQNRQQQRGRPGAPPYRPDPDHYSISRPPGWVPLGQGPVGEWDVNDEPAFLGSKPILMKTPEPFKGDHDDMDRFLGDCHTYFEVYRHQFRGVSSLMVIFATSHFAE